jgi:hypothetical protein
MKWHACSVFGASYLCSRGNCLGLVDSVVLVSSLLSTGGLRSSTAPCHSLHLYLLLGADGLSPLGHAGRRASPADRFRSKEHREEVPHGAGAHGATVSTVPSCCGFGAFL